VSDRSGLKRGPKTQDSQLVSSGRISEGRESQPQREKSIETLVVSTIYVLRKGRILQR
jgi:hypothetical protein